MSAVSREKGKRRHPIQRHQLGLQFPGAAFLHGKVHQNGVGGRRLAKEGLLIGIADIDVMLDIVFRNVRHGNGDAALSV